MSLFAISDTLVKTLFDRLPVGQVIALRGLLITSLLTVFLVVRHRRLVLGHLLERVALARAVIEVAVAFAFFKSLALMPLADATVILFASPIIMTLAAALFLGERVGPRRWAAVLVGFAGVVLVAGPGNQTIGWAALLPLTAAVLVTVRDLITRFVPKSHDSTTVALTTAIAVSIGGWLSLPAGAIGFAGIWLRPTAAEWLVIAASAVLIGTAYNTVVIGYRLGEASFLAPFRYTSIPLAILLSWTVFGDIPSPAMLTGALIIAGSGIFIFARERQLARRAELADGALPDEPRHRLQKRRDGEPEQRGQLEERRADSGPDLHREQSENAPPLR
jgi:drug/metabolite transporter (DMT)-like permease